MTKSTISRIWIVGLIVLVIGLIIGGVSLGLMLANGGRWVPATVGNGYDFVPNLGPYFWTTVSFMIAGFAIAAIGAIVQMAAWVGALVNTYQIPDRTWFVVLLVGGVLGLAFGLIGFAVMVAYVVAGPDGTAYTRHEMPAYQQYPAPQPPQQQQQQYPAPPEQQPTPPYVPTT